MPRSTTGSRRSTKTGMTTANSIIATPRRLRQNSSSSSQRKPRRRTQGARLTLLSSTELVPLVMRSLHHRDRRRSKLGHASIVAGIDVQAGIAGPGECVRNDLRAAGVCSAGGTLIGQISIREVNDADNACAWPTLQDTAVA